MQTIGPEKLEKPIDCFLSNDGFPNWDAIDFDVTCSRCGYNLRTLARPMCTECGFEFEWRALIRGYFAQNPNLFEHTWSRRPIRAMLYAVFAPIFRPRSYWKRISLHDRIVKGPLFALLPLSVLMGLFLFHVAIACFWGVLEWTNYSSSTIFRYGSGSRTSMVEKYFQACAGVCRAQTMAPIDAFADWAVIPIYALVTPWAVLGLFVNLHDTIAQFKLRPAHMLRVIAYAMPPAFGLMALMLLIGQFAFLFFRFWIRPPGWVYISMIMLFIMPLIVQIRAGLRHYLGIPHATLAAILGLIVGALVSTIAVMLFANILNVYF